MSIGDESAVDREQWFRSVYSAEGGRDGRAPNLSGWSDEQLQYAAYDEYLDLVPACGRVLDLGCGDGALLHHLVTKRPCVEPYGVDLVCDSVHRARDRLPSFCDNLTCAEVGAFVRDAPSQFDLVLTCPDYVPAWRQSAFLDDCYRLLSPGGKLVLYLYRGDAAEDDLLESWFVEARRLDAGACRYMRALLRAIVLTSTGPKVDGGGASATRRISRGSGR